jgi:hypothetical protein
MDLVQCFPFMRRNAQRALSVACGQQQVPVIALMAETGVARPSHRCNVLPNPRNER